MSCILVIFLSRLSVAAAHKDRLRLPCKNVNSSHPLAYIKHDAYKPPLADAGCVCPLLCGHVLLQDKSSSPSALLMHGFIRWDLTSRDSQQ